jgi:hypothetical protein
MQPTLHATLTEYVPAANERNVVIWTRGYLAYLDLGWRLLVEL